MTSSQPSRGPAPASSWSDLLRWLARTTLEELRDYDEQWWLRTVVPQTDADGFPVPDWGPGYMDELVELHRGEMALLFAEAAELRIAQRPPSAFLLGPRLDPWRENRWRRRAHGRLKRALGRGLEVPLGLLVCWVWPSTRWLGAEVLAMASLKFEATPSGRLVYARSRLADPQAAGIDSAIAELEGLLARTRLDRRSRAAAWQAVTLASLHERRGDLAAALAAYLRASRDDGSLGAWARGLGLALALLLGDRRALFGLRRARGPSRSCVVRHAESESLAEVEGRLEPWIETLGTRSSDVGRELFELVAGEDDLGAAVAFEVAAMT